MARPSFLSAILLVLVAVVLATTGGCSQSEAAPKAKCTPGKSYFCKCADLSDGEKVCKKDGNGFEACMQGEELCPGGELPPDEDAGVIEVDAGSTTSVEICPGKGVTVEPGKPVTLKGNTTGAQANHKGASGRCALAEAEEHIYAVKPTADGQLRVEGQGLHDVAIYARDGDCATGRQIDCRDDTAAGAREAFTITVAAGKTYWIFVDGKAGQTGEYTLTLSLNAGPKCNDGVVQDGEACDDGNQVDDDGCNQQCQPQGDASNLGRCDATGHGTVKVHVWNAPVTFTGSTSQMGMNFSTTLTTGTCVSSGANYVDRAYAVIPHKSGTLTVTLSNTNFDQMLYAREGCAATTDLACSDANNDATGESISFPVTVGKTYDVIVDGSYNSQVPLKGSFTMTLSIQ
jgi:cysteine-rich repeat protein